MATTPITVLPFQAATWARLKAENHQYYTHTRDQALRDNTPSPRYASFGRWSALYYQMSQDQAFAQRSYDHIKNSWPEKTFATAPLWTSNQLREFGTEMVVTLDWIRDAISSSDFIAYRDWLVRTADAYLKGSIRLGDTDQVVGALFFVATMDRVLGTTYLTNPRVIEMRDKVRWYCDELADGGEWMESGDYNQGTTYLLFNGAESAGMNNFPAVEALRSEIIKFFPHTYTPDLKDSFEWGDDQTPHDPHWLSIENLMAYYSRYSPEIRQFEEDMRKVWNKPYGAPFYARYFVWADPFGEKKPWKEFVGTHLVARGRGHVYSRTGWEPTDAAIMVQTPTFSKGRVDHWYAIFGDFWFRKGGEWKVDRPRAYSGDLRLGNHTIIAGIGAPGEVGDLTGVSNHPKMVYASGSNAGIFAEVGRASNIPTLLHERSVSVFWLKDRNVILHVLRIHLDAITGLDAYAEAGDKPKVLAAPIIQSLWQSQRIQPVVAAGVIQGDSLIQPLYPATFEVIDQVPLSVGTIFPTEKKWYVNVQPITVQPFQVLNTLIGDAMATVENLGDMQRVRVKTVGFPDALIYSSTRPGLKLVSTMATNQWGGKTVLHDPTKISNIKAGRNLFGPTISAETDADVYLEFWDHMELLTAAPPPPPPPPPAFNWRIADGSTDERIILEKTT